jgi:hypothetical protein
MDLLHTPSYVGVSPKSLFITDTSMIKARPYVYRSTPYLFFFVDHIVHTYLAAETEMYFMFYLQEVILG